MKKEYIIAYDCGTTALKTVLISSDGTVIGDARADNPLIQKEASWAEIEPAVIWGNICDTTKELVEKNEHNMGRRQSGRTGEEAQRRRRILCWYGTGVLAKADVAERKGT